MVFNECVCQQVETRVFFLSQLLGLAPATLVEPNGNSGCSTPLQMCASGMSGSKYCISKTNCQQAYLCSVAWIYNGPHSAAVSSPSNSAGSRTLHGEKWEKSLHPTSQKGSGVVLCLFLQPEGQIPLISVSAFSLIAMGLRFPLKVASRSIAPFPSV